MVSRTFHGKVFFLDEHGRMAFCEKCRTCARDCRQSYRAVVMYCPIYESKYGKEWSTK